MFSGSPGHRAAPVLKSLARMFAHVGSVLAVSTAGCTAAAAQDGPTVKDVVEFTRIVYPGSGNADELRAQVSPDGTRAFIVTRKANTRTDRNRYEILMLDVRPQSLAAGVAAAPVTVLALEPVLDSNSGYPAVQALRWVGDRTIVFLARLEGLPFQVYKVDTISRKLTRLTHSPTDVTTYAISDDLKRVVYAALQHNPPLQPGKRSVVVGNQSFWNVKFGQQDTTAQLRRYQFFVANSDSREPGRPLGPSFAEAGSMTPAPSISPDGRWAIVPRYAPERQLGWTKLYPLIAQATERQGPSVSVDPLSYFSRPSSYVPRRLIAYRLADNHEQVVVDAPDDTTAGNTQSRSDRLWQVDGRSVVMAGIHLPSSDGAAPLSGASHVIEYWPDTGRWKVIATLSGRLDAAYRLVAGKDHFVAIDAGRRRYFERRPDGAWQELDSAAGASIESAAPALGGWTLQVREALDLPPDIFAEGPGGSSTRLTTLNPQVSPAWGSVRLHEWKDAKGRTWNGGLLVPAGFDPRRSYPLVIQTYGFSPKRFYLDGSNIMDGFTSGFAGRAFLRENMLVLAFPLRASSGGPPPLHEADAIAAFMDGVRGAVDSLVSAGMVDKERVGIMGWSSTGERVLNQVTFSDAPIRSASILDGDANTVFSLAVTYARSDGTQVRKARTNRGLPFGETLPNWVENDPAMHTDCIRAAVRIETYGPWVLNNWDVYALLRRQYKPVEMVVIPGGNHGLLTPSERMISLQGNVDWHRFWLKGEERTDAFVWGESDESLQEQYRHWREMWELKRAVDAKPECPRRKAS